MSSENSHTTMADESDDLDSREKPFGEIESRTHTRFGTIGGGAGGGFHALLDDADRERGFLSRADRERLLEMGDLDLSDTTQRNARTRIRNRVLSTFFDSRYLQYVHERDRALIFENARKQGCDLHFREGFKEFVRFTYRGLKEDESDIDITNILETAIQEAEEQYATAAGQNHNIKVKIEVENRPADSIHELERRYSEHDYLTRDELEVLVNSEHTNEEEDLLNAADITLVDALYYDARQPESDLVGYSWEDPDRKEAKEIVEWLRSKFEEYSIDTYDELEQTVDRLDAFDEDAGQELRAKLNHLSREAPNFVSQMASDADLPERDMELLHDILWNPDNLDIEEALSEEARPRTAGTEWSPDEDESLQRFIARVEVANEFNQRFTSGGEEGKKRWQEVLSIAEFDADEWKEYMRQERVNRLCDFIEDSLGDGDLSHNQIQNIESYDDLTTLCDVFDDFEDFHVIAGWFSEEIVVEALNRVANSENIDE